MFFKVKRKAKVTASIHIPFKHQRPVHNRPKNIPRPPFKISEHNLIPCVNQSRGDTRVSSFWENIRFWTSTVTQPFVNSRNKYRITTRINSNSILRPGILGDCTLKLINYLISPGHDNTPAFRHLIKPTLEKYTTTDPRINKKRKYSTSETIAYLLSKSSS